MRIDHKVKRTGGEKGSRIEKFSRSLVLAQRFEGVVKPGFNGSQGNLESNSDFLKTQPIEKAQEEHLAVLCGEIRQNVGQRFARSARGSCRRSSFNPFGHRRIIQRIAVGFSARLKRQMFHHGIEKCLELARESESGKFLKEINERLLQDVESEIAVARKTKSQTGHPIAIAVVQDFERGTVAAVGGRDQFLVIPAVVWDLDINRLVFDPIYLVTRRGKRFNSRLLTSNTVKR
jgi:hypothetical protein